MAKIMIQNKMDANVIGIFVTVEVKWECPNCHTLNVTKFSPSAYRIPADEVPEDEQCPNCKEFFDIKL